MNHACNRRGRARLDVGDRTGDRTRGGNAAEEGNNHISDPLAHQLLVRIVTVVGHRVGDARAKQAFDRTEHGDREHGTVELFGGRPVEVGECKVGELLRNAAEFRADRLDRDVEEAHECRREYEHDYGAREMRETLLPLRTAHLVALRPELDEKETRRRDPECPRVDRVEVSENGRNHAEKVGRHFFNRQTEEVLHLLHADHHGDAVREADHDRYGNEFDEAAELEEPHQEEDDARAEGGKHQVREPVLGDDPVDDDDEGAGRAADLNTATAEKRNEKTGDDGGVEPRFRRNPGGDAEGHRQGERHHADREAGRDVAGELMTIVGSHRLEENGGELREGHVVKRALQLLFEAHLWAWEKRKRKKRRSRRRVHCRKGRRSVQTAPLLRCGVLGA